jgi:hypothetical protein
MSSETSHDADHAEGGVGTAREKCIMRCGKEEKKHDRTLLKMATPRGKNSH